jgi:hypothetical protein
MVFCIDNVAPPMLICIFVTVTVDEEIQLDNFYTTQTR